MTRSRVLLLIVAAALAAAFFALDLGRFLSLEYFKSQQAAIEAWRQAHPLQTAALYFAVYVAVTALSLPGAALAHSLGHSFTSALHNRQGGFVMAHLLRSRLNDIALVLLGAVALVTKRHINVGIVQSYGGNIAASFSTFFLLKLPFVPTKFQAVTAAALALLATELFEASNGFGFMSNTYDSAVYLANALGVALAAGVNTALQIASRPRKTPNDSPSGSR